VLFLLPRGSPVICALFVPFLAYAAVLPDAMAVMLIDISSAEPFIVLLMAIVLLLLPRLALVLAPERSASRYRCGTLVALRGPRRCGSALRPFFVCSPLCP